MLLDDYQLRCILLKFASVITTTLPCNHDLLQQYSSYKTVKDPTVLMWHMLLGKMITHQQKTSENENFDIILQSDSNQMTFLMLVIKKLLVFLPDI